MWGAKEKLGQEKICIQKAQSKKGGKKHHKLSFFFLVFQTLEVSYEISVMDHNQDPALPHKRESKVEGSRIFHHLQGPGS